MENYFKNNVQIAYPAQLMNELLDAALSNEVAFDPKVTGDQTLSLEFMEGLGLDVDNVIVFHDFHGDQESFCCRYVNVVHVSTAKTLLVAMKVMENDCESNLSMDFLRQRGLILEGSRLDRLEQGFAQLSPTPPS
eukprot:gene6047-4342_t